MNYFSEENDKLDLVVFPGTDETELRFNWMTPAKPQNVVLELWKNEERFIYIGDCEPTSFNCPKTGDVRYANKVTAFGLKPNTTYHYRVGDGMDFTKAYTAKTPAKEETQAYVLTDIHVLDLWNLQESIDNWTTTLAQMREDGKTNLLLSLGDQTQNSNLEYHLDGFFGNKGLPYVTLAPINGNHDLSPHATTLPLFTNVPNRVFPESMGISDYYFKSGRVLFVMLSITDINFDEVDHEKTFQEAIKAYPDYDFLVATCHEAIYGYYIYQFIPLADEVDVSEQNKRVYGQFIDLFERYHVDMVLTGHSHSYCRSYFMKDYKIATSAGDSHEVTNPDGVVYVNLGISSRQMQFRNQDPTPKWPWAFIEYAVHGKASYDYAYMETNNGSLSLTVHDLLHPEIVLDTLTIHKTKRNASC